MDGPDYDALAGALRALGNPARLDLLAQLGEPRPLGELRLRPSRAGAHDPRRAVTRTAVEKHARKLQEAGLVAAPSGRGQALAVDRAALFRLCEALHGLAGAPAPPGPFPPGPALVALGWADGGRAFPLAGGPDGGWLVGSHPRADVALPHDPWLAPRHAAVLRGAGGFAVRALADLRLNGAPLAAGREAPLAHGDVLHAGRSALLFRG